LTVVFAFGNAANHKGPCQAFLRSVSDPSINVNVGYKEDCAQDLFPASTMAFPSASVTPAYLPINIPDGYTHIQDPYIWTQLEAHHTAPPYERYEDAHDFIWDAFASNTITSDIQSTYLAGITIPGDSANTIQANAPALPTPANKQVVADTASSDGAQTEAAAAAQATVVAPPPENFLNIVQEAVVISDSPATTQAASQQTVDSSTIASRGSGASLTDCDSHWESCNVAWLQNGATGPNSCQQEYQTCQASAIAVHKRRMLMRIARQLRH